MTVPSADLTYCEPDRHFFWYDPSANGQPIAFHPSVFSTSLTNYSSLSPSSPAYRLCLAQGAYCKLDFFGPVFQTVVASKQHFTNQYFISPLDRRNFSGIADLELEETSNEVDQSQWHTYLVGLFDKGEVSLYSSEQSQPGIAAQAP